METTKNISDISIICRSLAITFADSGNFETKPGANIGVRAWPKSKKTIAITRKSANPIVIIVEASIHAFSILSRAKYLEKTGINARAILPKIKTSKIES